MEHREELPVALHGCKELSGRVEACLHDLHKFVDEQWAAGEDESRNADVERERRRGNSPLCQAAATRADQRRAVRCRKVRRRYVGAPKRITFSRAPHNHSHNTNSRADRRTAPPVDPLGDVLRHGLCTGAIVR